MDFNINHDKKCPTCFGTGRIREATDAMLGDDTPVGIDCHHCNGTGQLLQPK